MVRINFDPGFFKTVDANPGGTLQLFEKYVNGMSLIFELSIHIVDGTPFTSSNKERKAMLLFQGKDGMKDLFQHLSNDG